MKLVAGLPGCPIPLGGKESALARLRNQLINGAGATTGKPVLGVTDAMTTPTRKRLDEFLKSLPSSARPEVVPIPESAITGNVDALRAALGLPAKIP